MATLKQKRLAKIIGNARNIKDAMLKAGYSPSTARQQETVTKSKAWPVLLEQFLPDDKLLKKHDEAMEATKQDQYTGEISPDHTIRLRAVELGYKVKNRLAPSLINLNETKILIMPQELIKKYDIPNKD